ncbi:hypothetical protein KC363_g3361 [Hortaea werneckii]|nr:hypothetical protein KC361_g3448 [Hortaea werneckii]KAI6885396.1 hypothetical protein KC325_g3590 [Hortaea werneckii]KAI6995389.1 hypothetical protein KC359_g4074 [Hortaea werneckii]KAI7146824.1 hypothetical protein KC344_g3342 [Hortaea werneckii]KAI7175893.1 hypothetical protein KC360_g3346 [Hortaea werneckii]
MPLPPQSEVPQQMPFHVDGPVDQNMSPVLNQDRRESALGMLAEVSRRHLDLREGELSQHQQRQTNPLGGQQVAEQALLLQQFQQAQDQAQAAKAYQNLPASPYKPEYVPRRIPAPGPPKGGERMDFTTVPSEHLDASGLNINMKLPAQSSRQAQSQQQTGQSQPSPENLDPQLQPHTSNFIPGSVPNSLDEFMVWNPTNTTNHAVFGLQSSTAGSDGHHSDSVWLIDERDFVSKLESYLARITSNWAEGEMSNFHKATLLKALDLAEEEGSSKANANHPPIPTSSATNVPTNSSPAARSCYNLQDSLLKNVLELWSATTLLSQADNVTMEAKYNADRSPLNEPESLDWNSGDKSANIEALPPASAKLVRRQLLAALEARCEKLGKSVINEIERRLLQRAQVSRFSTFLSSVLLLSAVERTSSLYRNFATELEDQNNSPISWPLETPPSRLWIQGPHFADLLIMLLRMRALPPQTKEDLNGKLVVEKDSTCPANMTGKIASRDQIEEQVLAAAEWLDGIGLDVAEIERAVHGGIGSDLCLVGKVLLPMKVDT